MRRYARRLNLKAALTGYSFLGAAVRRVLAGKTIDRAATFGFS